VSIRLALGAAPTKIMTLIVGGGMTMPFRESASASGAHW